MIRRNRDSGGQVLLVLDAREPSASLRTRSALLQLAGSVVATTPISDGGYAPMGSAGAFCNKGWVGAETMAMELQPGGVQLLGLVMQSGAHSRLKTDDVLPNIVLVSPRIVVVVVVVVIVAVI
jgi:hypothetical protein